MESDASPSSSNEPMELDEPVEPMESVLDRVGGNYLLRTVTHKSHHNISLLVLVPTTIIGDTFLEKVTYAQTHGMQIFLILDTSGLLVKRIQEDAEIHELFSLYHQTLHHPITLTGHVYHRYIARILARQYLQKLPFRFEKHTLEIY